MSFGVQASNFLPSLSSLESKINQISINLPTIPSSLLNVDIFNSVSSLVKKSQMINPFSIYPTNNSNESAPSFSQIRKGEVMQKGDKGESVRELQQKLTSFGFGVQITGHFGNTTEAKLKEFQKQNGISQTGKLGPTTIKSLDRPVLNSSVKSDLGKPTVLGTKLAQSAKKIASARSTVGWCYAGVADAVSRVAGNFLYGRSAYMAAPILANNSKFKEVKVKASDLPKLPAGSIVVWGKTSVSPHGHISVALGNGKEASDHIANQMTSLRGHKNVRVFTAVA